MSKITKMILKYVTVIDLSTFLLMLLGDKTMLHLHFRLWKLKQKWTKLFTKINSSELTPFFPST